MKRKISIQILTIVVSVLYHPAFSQGIIANHQSTNLQEIPSEWIQNAKTDFKIWYGHTSHGSQITTGMQTLENHIGEPYTFDYSGSSGSLSYQEEESYDLGHNGDLSWYYLTINKLNNPNNDRNVVMWSWCGGVSDNTPEGIDIYLNAMNLLEQSYPDVKFIYMTGHLDIWADANLKAGNQQIREYCIENNKILFDFADIESYNPNGTYFEYATDNCDYYQGPGWGYLGNWADEWCLANPGSDLCWSCSCAHSKALNCNLKGRAFWWLLAKMAGWGETPPQRVFYVDKNNPEASNSNPGTELQPWLSIQHAANVVTAGDSVLIREGVYFESITTQNDGNPEDGYIVFAAFPGESVEIYGTGVNTSTGIYLLNNYIKLCGLEVRNWSSTGIWIQNASFFELHNLEVHDLPFGIGITGSSHDFVVSNCEIYNFDLYGVDASPYEVDFCYNGYFSNCSSHSGRDMEQNVDGFALGHGNQNNFIFENCVTFGVYDGFDISSKSTTLQGCLAYQCGNTCYKLWDDEVELINCIGYNGEISIVQLGWRGYQTETTLRNCTFYDAEIYTIWQANQNDILNMYNCIVSGGDNIGLAFEENSAVNYHGDYNLFQNNNPERAISIGYTTEFSIDDIANGIWASYQNEDANSLIANSAGEIYLIPAIDELRLCQGSPAIDQASGLWAPSTDFDGNPRPYNSIADIGAFESQGTFYHTQTVVLKTGWTGLSSYVVPENSDIEFLFGSIANEMAILQNQNGVYLPSLGINTIGNWNADEGYFIKMNEEAVLKITGTLAPENQIMLEEGWNLVAINSPCALTIETLNAQIGDVLIVVKEPASVNLYWPAMNIQTMDSLKPGKSYFIFLIADAVLNFQECGE